MAGDCGNRLACHSRCTGTLASVLPFEPTRNCNDSRSPSTIQYLKSQRGRDLAFPRQNLLAKIDLSEHGSSRPLVHSRRLLASGMNIH